MPVQKTAQGRWRATLKDGRLYVTSKTFDRKSDASAWLDREQRLLRIGETANVSDGKVQLKDLAERWLESRKGKVAEKTYQTDELMLRLHLPSRLRNTPASAVLTLHIEATLDELSKSLSMASVRRFRGTISSMFGWAVRQKILRSNPVTSAQMPRTSLSPAREIHPFTLTELNAVYSKQAQLNPRLAECVLVLGLTGLRWGELRSLRVSDYKRSPYPVLIVRRSAPDGVAERETTKSGKSRMVPLPNSIVAILEQRVAGKEPTQLIFTGPQDRRLHGSNFRRDLNWAATARGRRVHDLRHTAAVLWLSSAVPPRTVQAWLGHSSMRVTEIYSHYLGEAADIDAIAKVNQFAGSAGGARANLETEQRREPVR